MNYLNSTFTQSLFSRPPVLPRIKVTPKVDFHSRLLAAVSAHKENVFLSDDSVQIDGLQAKKIIENLSKTLEKVCPEQSFVVVSLPHSAAQAITIIAVLLSKRIPVVVYPSTLNRVLPDLKSIGEPSAVISFEDGSEEEWHGAKILVNTKGEVLSDFSHRLYWKAAEEVRGDGTPALVIYTSGSSGAPKAVAISIGSISYIAETIQKTLNLSKSTIAAISMPLFHTLALNTQFLPTILGGGRCVFTSAELQLNALYRNYLKTQGNYLALIPDVLIQCYQEFMAKGLEPNCFVKTIAIAGSNISREHLRIAELLFPEAEVFKGYGLTEAIRVSMISNRDPDFFKDVSGRPLPGQVVSIRGPNGESLSQGGIGEIFVKGPNTANFYLNYPKPMLASDGFLATGDQGYLNPKGMLVILGRADRVFKSQGRKIAPLEIEKLAMVDATVAQTICIPGACRQKGLRSVLFVRVFSEPDHEGLMNLAANLQAGLFQSLEPYKRPKEVYISLSLPKLSNGKPNLNALKKILDGAGFLAKKSLSHKGMMFHWHDGALGASQ
jgi:acyl-CoA synthetase (AMP-forming)/AMP-acid ligase II